MKHRTWITLLFLIAAVYDEVLGVMFLAFGPYVFERAGINPPNHWGYVQFPAALLVVFGIMFLAVAVRPVANRNLIPYGILLKISYAGVVLYYWIVEPIPLIWKPFAVADLVFMILFAWAFISIANKKTAQ